jgi:hypothetical protein
VRASLPVENLARPAQAFIRIEIPTEDNHEVNVFADIAFGCDPVTGGAPKAVSDGFAELPLTQSRALLREKFPQMNDHPVFEILYVRLRKHLELLQTDG